jgi:TolB protein
MPVRSDGAERLNISVNGSLQNPAWSPSGTELLFTSFHEGYNSEPADLIVFNTASGEGRILVSDKNGNINLPGSAWNRISDHIVYSSTRDPHDEIYTIYAYGRRNNGWNITDRENLAAYEPSLSPDGEWIVFESHPLEVEGDGVITKYKIDGDQPYQTLTPEGEDCRQPNWSPAGNLILYQKFSDGKWDIWTMTPDGRNHRRISSGPGDKTDASFSPDGKWIIYSSDEGELRYANLFIIGADGGSSTRLTQYEGYDGAPSWSPDGRWIVFESSPGKPSDSEGTSLWRIPVPPRFTLPHLFTGDFET